MRKILVLGAGRSAVTLIKYLLFNAEKNHWVVTIADFSKKLAEKAGNNNKNARSISFDVNNDCQRNHEITNHEVIISMLPARMHFLVAKDCVDIGRHLVTASYVSKEISELDQKAKQKGVILLNEIGLDPGIDHMSAMRVIDNIKKGGGEITSFKSFCGGLVHPDFDNNPWNYKFTWNPRNVVLAGKGTAQYIKHGRYKYIPYHKLFQRTEVVNIINVGDFEGYPNRDSLAYRELYGLEGIPTMLRGTLRRRGYSKSWNVFVQLGMTDDSYRIKDSANMTYREFMNLFLPYDDKFSVEQKFCNYFSINTDSNDFKKVDWLGIFTEQRINIEDATPAQILQSILERKWSLDIKDKDMIIMQHQFDFLQDGKQYKLDSSLCVFGDDSINTAMARTVGLPVAIATKLILENKIKSIGVQIPITEDIYIPVLKELAKNGVVFQEKVSLD